MKNSQYIRRAQYEKGFIVPLLLVIIAVLVIGGGVYIYNNKKVEAPVTNTGTQQTYTQTPPVNTSTNASITVLSPNGRETWQNGSTYTISWRSANLPSTAKIYVSLIKGFKGDIDYNEKSKNVVSGLSSTVTSYSWKVDTIGLVSGNDYTIVVVANWGDFDAGTFARTYDSSNTSFTITSAVVPVLTQAQAQTLVLQTWGGCTPDSCGSVNVTVQNSNGQYTVTAIYEGLRDDSSSAQKKVALASYNNGVWTLGSPTVTQRCQPGRGHQDFSAALCI